MPTHQRVARWIQRAVIGALALGGALDAIGNATTLISPRRAAALTVAIALVWLGLRVLLRRWPLPWMPESGGIVRLHRPPKAAHAWTVGALVLVWLGAASYAPPPTDDPGIATTLSAALMPLDERLPNDVVFVIPPAAIARDAAYRETHLPLSIRNPGRRTVDNVVLAVRYPPATRLFSQHPMRMQALGPKDSANVRRKTEQVDDVSMSFLSVDNINPGTALDLNEPIELPRELCASPRSSAQITIDLSARDAYERHFDLRVHCVVATFTEEADAIQRRLIWEQAVARRKSMGYLAYLRYSLRAAPAYFAVVVPSFQLMKDHSGRYGYQSDAMASRLRVSRYNPAPIAWLAPRPHSNTQQ